MMERLSELEAREEELQDQIEFEKLKVKKTLLTKDQIIYWLTLFKDGDIHSPEFCDKLINLFIDKVVVFPDKIQTYYNYMDKGHQHSFNFFSQPVLDTGPFQTLLVSPSQTLIIRKNSFCLEIKRPCLA